MTGCLVDSYHGYVNVSPPGAFITLRNGAGAPTDEGGGGGGGGFRVREKVLGESHLTRKTLDA